MATTPKKTTTATKKKAPVKRTAIKSIKAAAPAAAPAAALAAPAAAVSAVETESEAPTLRKKELIDRVVARSGIKKKDAKPTVEAMLAVLGEALGNGEELNLHPFGKMKVTRVIDKPNATVMVTKVRRHKEPDGGTVVKIGAKT